MAMVAARGFAVVAVLGGVAALDNGFDSPPMGWSALYGAPFNQVNETILIRAAEGLKASGLAAKGYEYVTIDDWWATRDAKTGDLMGVPDKFPSGMAAIGKAIHAQGCKFGVYSAASERTCGNWSASLFNEKRDAHTMAIEWEIDFLKYDACLYNGGVASRARYEAMSRALNATGRKIFYSVEGWNPDQGDWGPELANMWRTGSDIWPFWDTCILHNLYQTNIAAPYNRHTMAANGQLADHAGGGYNDGDMLQPPGDTLITVRSPGLTSTEAASQFKLWSIMKAPLILGVNWQQLASLPTLDPVYFALITNDEILEINQDPSPQAILVSQAPSKAQQMSTVGLNVTVQACDLGRPDQRFAASKADPTGGALKIKHTDSDLCLSVDPSPTSGGGLGVKVKPCADVLDTFTLQQDEELTIPKVTAGAGKGRCLAESPLRGAEKGYVQGTLSVTQCSHDVPIVHNTSADPVPLKDEIASQIFVWGEKSQQIVTGSSGNCLTVGNPNMGFAGHDGNAPGEPNSYTNNGTLHHEVWLGPLTSSTSGARRQVVGLLNKGPDTETVTAPANLLGGGTWKVRDVVGKKNLPTLAAGSDLHADVPSHGVALYLLVQST